MTSRGTMGIRLSRIRVDDVLNIATLRAYPSNVVRFLDNITPMATNSLVYVKLAEITLPVEYQYPSTVRAKATIGADNNSVSIDVRVSGIPGVYTSTFTNPAPGFAYTNLMFDLEHLGQGGFLPDQKISWWLKSGNGTQVNMPSISVCCGNESVIDGKNPGTW